MCTRLGLLNCMCADRSVLSSWLWGNGGAPRWNMDRNSGLAASEQACATASFLFSYSCHELDLSKCAF